MKVLMVSIFLPHLGALNGCGLVMYGQLSVLAQRHDVTLATLAGPDASDENAIAGLRARGIKVRYVWRAQPSGFEFFRLATAVATGMLRGGRPLRALVFHKRRFQRVIDRLLAENRFDLIHVEDNAMGGYRYPSGIAKVLTEHEVRRFPPADNYDRCRPVWLRRRLSEMDWRRWQHYQPSTWRKFDRIQVFTARDAESVGSMAPDIADRVRVNPFGITLPDPVDPNREQSHTLVFVGGFGHPPNVDAAVWLAEEIMPLIKQEIPDVQLRIVGHNPPERVRALATDHIAVTGRVPSVDPFLEQAAVVVAPVRKSGGMRVKVVQAMAKGKAVVTTPLGIEGLAIDGRQPPLVVAESGAEFAHATATLLQDQPTRAILGRSARSFVAKYHTWEAYGERLEGIYGEMLSLGTGKP